MKCLDTHQLDFKWAMKIESYPGVAADVCNPGAWEAEEDVSFEPGFGYIASGRTGCSVTISVVKFHEQSNREKSGLFGFHSTSQPITEGGQVRNSDRAGLWSKELMQRPWGVLFTSLGLSLPYRTQDHQLRDGPTHNGIVLPPPSLRKCLQPDLTEAFS